MRLLPILAATLALLFIAPEAARAQSLSQNAGPAELPPAGFSGRSFVDSRGCIFIRAGGAARVTWVPRVTRNAQLMCGFQPTFAKGSGQVAATPAAVAPANQPLRQPAAPSASVVVAKAPVKPRLNHSVPKGYVPAWTDGRLNPNRGPRTAEGDMQMAAIWTNKVPMKMRDASEAPAQTSPVVTAGSSRRGSGSIADTAGALTSKFFRSTKSPQAGGKFIQIGTYADPANAQRAIARVQQLGLPAVRQSTTMGGQAVQVVLAGPVTPDLALQAQQALRRAGYSDAFVR